MNPFTALKKLSPLHFIFFTCPINPSLHFTLLFMLIISTTHFTSLHFTSLPFIFYRFHFPSLVFTFLTLVLKTRVLPWEVPIVPSGSWFQSVMDLFTKEYFPMSVLCFLKKQEFGLWAVHNVPRTKQLALIACLPQIQERGVAPYVEG